MITVPYSSLSLLNSKPIAVSFTYIIENIKEKFVYQHTRLTNLCHDGMHLDDISRYMAERWVPKI